MKEDEMKMDVDAPQRESADTKSSKRKVIRSCLSCMTHVMPLDLSNVPSACQCSALKTEPLFLKVICKLSWKQRARSTIAASSSCPAHMSSTVRGTSQSAVAFKFFACVVQHKKQQHGNSCHITEFQETRNCSHQRLCPDNQSKASTFVTRRNPRQREDAEESASVPSALSEPRGSIYFCDNRCSEKSCWVLGSSHREWLKGVKPLLGVSSATTSSWCSKASRG